MKIGDSLQFIINDKGYSFTIKTIHMSFTITTDEGNAIAVYSAIETTYGNFVGALETLNKNAGSLSLSTVYRFNSLNTAVSFAKTFDNNFEEKALTAGLALSDFFEQL